MRHTGGVADGGTVGLAFLDVELDETSGRTVDRIVSHLFSFEFVFPDHVRDDQAVSLCVLG